MSVKSLEKTHNCIVVGSKGEIGSALMRLIQEAGLTVLGVDKDDKDFDASCNYLHIAIPYSNEFDLIVNSYALLFAPKLIIIHSTVQVGTTKKVQGPIVHSPVNAKHPHILEGLKTYVKFYGYDDTESGALAEVHLSKMFKTYPIKGTEKTELMKLLCLTRYGMYLSIADEMKAICEHYHQDYNESVKLWEFAYNEGMGKIDPDKRRPVYMPPDGKIGGHCVLQNMEVLNEKIHSEAIAKVIEKYKGVALQQHLPLG